MFGSIRYAHSILRVSCALVFFWFGFGKFIQPEYWIAGWIPGWTQRFFSAVHIAPTDLIVLLGIFEIIVGISLLTGFFMRWFAGAAVLLLVAVAALHGPTDAVVRDIGLIGSLVALIAWPERPHL